MPAAFASASAAAATNCNLLQIRGQLGDRMEEGRARERERESGEDHFEPSLFGAGPPPRFSRVVEYFVWGPEFFCLVQCSAKRIFLGCVSLPRGQRVP